MSEGVPARAADAIIAGDTLRLQTSRTLRFEGAEHGSGVSFFLVSNEPGQGAQLHRHPYTETWVVLEGEVSFRCGEEVVQAGVDDIVVVQPRTWHGFTNTGDGLLRMMCIHASPRIIQEDHPEAARA